MTLEQQYLKKRAERCRYVMVMDDKRGPVAILPTPEILIRLMRKVWSEEYRKLREGK